MWQVKILNTHGSIVEETWDSLDQVWTWLADVIGEENIRAMRISNKTLAKAEGLSE